MGWVHVWTQRGECGRCMYGHIGESGVQVWSHRGEWGRYMYGHIGESGVGTCMDT